MHIMKHGDINGDGDGDGDTCSSLPEQEASLLSLPPLEGNGNKMECKRCKITSSLAIPNCSTVSKIPIYCTRKKHVYKWRSSNSAFMWMTNSWSTSLAFQNFTSPQALHQCLWQPSPPGPTAASFSLLEIYVGITKIIKIIGFCLLNASSISKASPPLQRGRGHFSLPPCPENWESH